MVDTKKITELTLGSTPLSGAELMEMVQSGNSVQIPASAFPPIGGSYITLSGIGALTGSRRLVAGSGISFVDGGAGSTLTISSSSATSFGNNWNWLTTATTLSFLSPTGVDYFNVSDDGAGNVAVDLNGLGTGRLGLFSDALLELQATGNVTVDATEIILTSSDQLTIASTGDSISMSADNSLVANIQGQVTINSATDTILLNALVGNITLTAADTVSISAEGAINVFTTGSASINLNSTDTLSLISDLTMSLTANTGNLALTATAGLVTYNGIEVGFRAIPPVVPGSGDYTFVLEDSGKHVRHAAGVGDTYTIPLDAAVAYDIGTAITLINPSADDVTLDGDVGVTLLKAGTGDAGPFVLAQYAEVTILKVDTDEWWVTGAGIP